MKINEFQLVVFTVTASKRVVLTEEKVFYTNTLINNKYDHV